MIEEPQICKFVEENIEEIMRKHMGMEGPFDVYREYSLPNGQRVDRVVVGTDKKLLGLFECKGEVGTNAFVGGIGQAVQGCYHIKKNLRSNFSENAQSFLVVPIELAESISLDLFDLSEIKVLLVDIAQNISVEYKKGSYLSSETKDWITINPYYFRDCSLNGIYFYLKTILKNSGELEKKTLAQMEDDVRKIRDDSKNDFFGDIRNNHIVPSVLGFYDSPSKNLTIRGYEFAKKDYFDFCEEIVVRELGEYSRAIFIALLYLSNEKDKDGEGFFDISTNEIMSSIKEIYLGKKVTYLFDPDGGNRNLLTMIRMLEGIGSIKKKSSSKIKLVYPPFESMPFRMKEYIKYPSEKVKFWFDSFGLSL